jgi:hypothetical protein
VRHVGHLPRITHNVEVMTLSQGWTHPIRTLSESGFKMRIAPYNTNEEQENVLQKEV